MMNKNLFSTTFALFIFPIYSTLFPSFFIQKNLHSEVIISSQPIFELVQPNQNFSFPVEKKGINTFQLCNLENEKNYQLNISDLEKSHDGEIYFLENPNEITRHLQINTSENCYEILIQNNFDSKQEITLSVQTIFKKKEESNQKTVSSIF